MRRWHWIALVLCVAATTVVWMQGQKLRQSATKADLIVPEQPQAEVARPDNSATNQVDSSEQTRELARLRSEVTRLRAQKKEFETARAENVELTSTKKPVARVTPPGFIGKETLANVGYATPENAMQTFFWAMREGNFDAVVTSFSPASKERQRFEKMSPEELEKLRNKLNGAGRSEFVDRLADVGVRAAENTSDESIDLHIGSSLSTNTVRMRLDRTAEGWKIIEPGF